MRSFITSALLLLALLLPATASAFDFEEDGIYYNINGEVNIADINAVIDIILGGSVEP